MEYIADDIIWMLFEMTEPMDIIKNLILVDKKWSQFASSPNFWAKMRIDRFGEIGQENVYDIPLMCNQKFLLNSNQILVTLTDSQKCAWAIENCYLGLLDKLLSNGCVLTNEHFNDEKYQNENYNVSLLPIEYVGLTPIHYAVKTGKCQIINLLLDYHYPIEMLKDGIHPIHYAAFFGYVDIIDLFLKKGVDINIKGSECLNTLYYAIIEMKFEAFKFLCENGTDDILEKDMYTCVANGGLEIAKYLISNYGPIDMNKLSESGGHILHHVLENHNDINYIDFLINQGADPNALNANGYPAIFSAINNIDFFKLLIEKYHVDPCIIINGRNILFECAYWQDTSIDVLNYLLNNFHFDLDLVCDNRTILTTAIECNKIDIIKLFIDAGANINLIVNEMTPLHVACRRGRLNVVKLLLDKGVETELPKCLSILFTITYHGCTNIMKYLLNNHAAKFRHTLATQHTLYTSIVNDYPDIAKLLIAAGHHLGSPKDKPLLQLVNEKGYTEIADLLIAAVIDN